VQRQQGKGKNGSKSGFFVISGRNSGEMEGESDACLKKQSQSPAFGRKSEALSSKSETTAFNRAQFEKTKPIPIRRS
jgi:hypothetical protein